MKGLILSVGGWLLLLSSAWAQEFNETRFHRVYLRNGNFIDGVILKDGPKILLLKVQSGELGVRKDMIALDEDGKYRVEFIKMRTYNEAPPRVEIKPEREEGPKIPAAADPRPGGAVKARVDRILSDLAKAGPDDRIVVLRTMGDLGKEETSYLASMIPSLDEDLRGLVAGYLFKKKDWSAPAAIEWLAGRKDPASREMAAQLIAAQGDPRQLKTLRALLKDEEITVRGASIDALRELGGKEEFSLVVALCSDPARKIRLKAIGASVQISTRVELKDEFIYALLAQIDRAPLEVCIDLLGAIGNSGQRDFGRNISRFLLDERAPIRAATAGALGDLGAADQGDSLISLLGTEKEKLVRAPLAVAAKKLKLWGAVSPLISWLGDEDSEISAVALSALTEITSQNFGTDKVKWSAWLEKAKPK